MPKQDEFKNFFQKSVFPYLTFGMCFPLAHIPKDDYRTGSRGFLAKRPSMGPNILHGACDLFASIGTVVYAVDDGIVVRGPYHFYLGVHAIEIKHSLFTVRYGEVKPETLVKAGDVVKKGQPIAHIGKVGRGSMLHFEMYSGQAVGRLTIKPKPPFNRRSDLMDPAPFLDVWKGNLPSK